MAAKQTTQSLREGRAKKRAGRDFGKGTGKSFEPVHSEGVKPPVNGGMSPPGKKITHVSVDAIIPDEPPRNGKAEITNPSETANPFKDWIFLSEWGGEKWGLDEEKLQEALAILADGGSRGDAADIVGCHRCTFNKLADICPKWSKAMLRAEATGKLYLIRRVRHGDSNWQSAAWMLAKKHNLEYGNVEDNKDGERQVIRVRPVGYKRPPELPAGDTNEESGSRMLETTRASEVDGDLVQGGGSNVRNGVDAVIDTDGSEIPLR